MRGLRQNEDIARKADCPPPPPQKGWPRGKGAHGGATSGWKGGYRRSEQRVGGNPWRVQSGSGAIGGGRKRLEALPVTPKGGKGGGGGYLAAFKRKPPAPAPSLSS